MWTLFEPIHAVTYFTPEGARLGPEATAEIAAALTPLARACATVLPYPSPIGLPAPGVLDEGGR
jgi:hypothetical protein